MRNWKALTWKAAALRGYFRHTSLISRPAWMPQTARSSTCSTATQVSFPVALGMRNETKLRISGSSKRSFGCLWSFLEASNLKEEDKVSRVRLASNPGRQGPIVSPCLWALLKPSWAACVEWGLNAHGLTELRLTSPLSSRMLVKLAFNKSWDCILSKKIDSRISRYKLRWRDRPQKLFFF